ncbi:hypothetical protein BD311DRAFT_777716 [Dichomitus squalens]|uniref:HNH nuclease domain-containing protein n=1 Tax=Dichomitus squalens TaxID=114155 RepID=A0A4Q9MN67_9APHY|nr:hypothetical protein BD311DRAFT_777716 [Dichomitus squalens]
MFCTIPRVAGRVLGYALIYAPSDVGRDCVAREVQDRHNDPEVLVGLAHLYIYGLIRIYWRAFFFLDYPMFINPWAVKNPKGPTPLISADSSPRQSFDVTLEGHARTRVEPGVSPQDLKDVMMGRDNYRCVFTNKPDLGSVRRHVVSADLQMLHASGGAVDLQVAHIISHSLTADVGGMTRSARDKLQWASSAAAVLDRFAGIEIKSILRNLDVHNPLNAFMTSHDPHVRFDGLDMWLTPSKARPLFVN